MQQPTTRRRAWLLALTAIFAIGAAACSSDSKSSTSSSSSSGSSSSSSVAGMDIDYATLTGSLKGGGSSFQDTFNQAVKVQFQSVAPSLTVDYAKSSSGDGITALAGNTLNFAGTDRPVKDTEIAADKILYFPTVGAPITVSFNLSGVTALKLSGPTIAKIFSGTVTTWNDPSIAADNSGTTLPATAIVVCHRGDNSGTTNNFTTYLKSAAPADMKLDVGGTVSNWPANSIPGTGNGGVAQCVSTNPNAIGYIDVADAIKAKLTYAEVKNKSGSFVKADLAGAEAALESSLSTVQPNLVYNPLDASGAASYPITSPTWIVIYKAQPDKASGTNVQGWLNFVLTQGQSQAPSSGYAALPAELQQKAITQLSSIVIPS